MHTKIIPFVLTQKLKTNNMYFVMIGNMCFFILWLVVECQRNCMCFWKKYKTKRQLKLYIFFILSKYLIVQTYDCAHLCTDIFYSLYANEKLVEKALNQLSRVPLEMQINLKRHNNVENVKYSK